MLNSKFFIILISLVGLISCGNPRKEKADDLYSKGIGYYERGNNKRALGFLTKAYKINPNYHKGVIILAKALLKKGTPKDASWILAKYVTKHKGDAYTWYLLGKSRFEERKHDAAIDSINEALKLKSIYPEAILLLGKIYEEHEEFIAAKEIYLNISDHMELGDKLTPILIRLAKIEMKSSKEKDKNNAIVHLITALRLNPYSKKAVITLGLYYLKQKKPVKAGEIFKKWLKKYPNDGLILLHMGQALLMQSKYKEAIEKYKKASSIRKDDILPLLGIKKAATLLKDDSYIYPALIKASTIEPSNLKIKWELIPWYIKKELYTVAMKNLIKCYKAYSMLPKYWELRSKVENATGDYRLAYESWMKILSLGGKSDLKFQKHAGILARYCGHYKISTKYLEPLLKTLPEDNEIKLNLALALWHLKEPENQTRGIEMLKSLTSAKWSMPSVWYAWYNLQIKNSKEAYKFLNTAKNLIKTDYERLFYLDVLSQYYKIQSNLMEYKATLKKMIPLSQNIDEKRTLKIALNQVEKTLKENKNAKKQTE